MRIKFFLTLLVFCLSVSSASAARADDGVDALKEPELVNELYTGQTTFVCNGHVFKIPSYFPYQKKWPEWKNQKFYLTANKDDCDNQKFLFSLGTVPNCNIYHTCTNVIFAHYQNKKAKFIKEEIIKNSLRKVMINKNFVGYFSPATCGANCNNSSLYWFDDSSAYIVETKNPHDTPETVDELVKSANSYINQKE